MNPFVSVIIPNYNHGEFLRERIDSVLNQSYQNFEVIILDDCSTDNSREIIESYRFHNRVSEIVFNEVNSGNTFIQWQKGISLTNGDWIWIAESDDTCEISLLQTLVNPVLANNSIVLSYCQSIAFNSNNEVIRVGSETLFQEVLSGSDFVSDYMAAGNAVYNASMAIFKKEAALTISNVFSEFKFCGDWRFWIEVSLQGQVAKSCKCLNYFRRHQKDVSNKAIKRGLFFTEGTEITKYLNSKVTLSIKQLEFAKTLWMIQYLNQKIYFQDKDVKKEVLESLQAIDNNFKWRLLKYRIKVRAISYIQKILG
ncbi:MAG: glycosyltransferase family 2 protein [Bacteroidetes bacterium]|nr:glycosyltransferase family 2 protein [Bacteroidota bacterium]